jgi:thiamine biosynthesis protein ThiI
MKAVALFSGGIDSPVATYLMLRKGIEVVPIFLAAGSYSSQGAQSRAIECMALLKKHGLREGYVLQHGAAIAEYVSKCDPKFTCIFCKRTMYRVAEEFAKRHGCSAVITGETLGSKASQTARSMATIQSSAGLPVLRPLLCMNKEEIMAISRSAGLLKTSSRGEVCCTAVPDLPSTKAKPGALEAEEAKLNIREMVEKSVNSATRVM